MADVVCISPGLTAEERRRADEALGVYLCVVCGSRRIIAISGAPAKDAADGLICPLCQRKEVESE